MQKQRIKILVICFIAGVLVVVGLFSFSKWKMNYGNGFIRKLPSHKIVGTGFIKFEGKSWYFAGGDTTAFYLGSLIQGNKMLKIGLPKRVTESIAIAGFDTMKFYPGFYLRVNGSDVMLMDGNKPTILAGDINSKKFSDQFAPPYYTAAVPTGSSQYILRVVKNGLQNNLVMLDRDSVKSSYSLAGDADGIFSNDGTLTSTPDGSKVFYTYYYTNGLLCFDSSLKLLYKGKTIDTVFHSKIKVDRIKSKGTLTLSTPPVFVNKQAAANDKWLFVHSALKAENEIKATLEGASVIDVYNVKDGSYTFSFYIGNVDSKMRDFRVYGNTLVALFDRYLYFYRLNF